MPTTASSVFDFIERHEACSIKRHEIASPGFGALRRSMGSIIRKLRESQDREANEISDQLRALLFTWLTSPVVFDTAIRDALRSFGEPEAFEARWDLRGEYKAALRAAETLILVENPIREQLRTAVRELRAQGRTFKIFCHRKGRPHFDSLFVPPLDAPLGDSVFLHSVRDYRETEPFGAIIKVGPLRSAGWGAAPDALISAPRFDTLVQIVWSGCGDEPGFGYDPVAPPSDVSLNPGNTPLPNDSALVNRATWTRDVTRSGEDPGADFGYTPEEDEFYSFREPNQPSEKRRATLVEIVGGDGVLYPPNSAILSFDPNPHANEPLALRLLGETLTAGMFVIQTLIGDVDFGGLLAAEGRCSRVWKQRLSEEMQINPEGICRILHHNGVTLLCLRSCVEHWCEPSTTVIHAPQQRKHFQILMEALAIDSGADSPVGAHGIPWWQRAWNEVRISRGEAIQAGVHGHEAIEDQALAILNGLLPEIRQKADSSPGFRLPIPPGHDLLGGFVFLSVLEVEEGFMVPEAELRVVRDLNSIEQWRLA
jgi:hypothetical protein